MHRSLVVGITGLTLSEQEQRWFSEHPPRGIILFARNVESPEQVQRLIAECKACCGEDIWVAVDEEGGRVYRMPWAPFHARKHATEYGALFQTNKPEAIAQVLADAEKVGAALRALGFTHDCAPVLDVFHATGDAIIGPRSYGSDVHTIAVLGTAYLQGLRAQGIAAIGKHFPGHGRADADSHLSLPRVNADADTVLAEAETFHRLFHQELQHVMTAHVIYPAVDAEMATFSKVWLHEVLREKMGFTGLVWSDDLCMKAVGDDVLAAAHRAKAAGCDILLVCQPEGVEQVYRQLN